jgi:hypothetical protein
MLSYLSTSGFSVVSGGAGVEVPCEDPLYKHIQLAKLHASRQNTNSSSSSSNAVAAPAIPASSCGWDGDDEGYSADNGSSEHTGGGGSGSSIVAGVYMPSVTDFIKQTSAPINLKPSATATSNTNTVGTTSAGNTGTLSTRELLAKQGSGRPVDLPPAAPKGNKKQHLQVTSATASGQHKQAIKDVKSTSSSFNINTANVKSSKPPTVAPVLVPVSIQKKDVVQEALSRFSPYYVLISGNGNECTSIYSKQYVNYKCISIIGC